MLWAFQPENLLPLLLLCDLGEASSLSASVTHLCSGDGYYSADWLGLNEEHLIWLIIAPEDEWYPVVGSRLSGPRLGPSEST